MEHSNTSNMVANWQEETTGKGKGLDCRILGCFFNTDMVIFNIYLLTYNPDQELSFQLT